MTDSSGLPTTERRTKIVCTLGPASRSPEAIENMIKAGMNVVRINMSHGTHDEHEETIRNVRTIARRLKVYMPIMLDLSGPKMRIGTFESGAVKLHAGDPFTLTSRDVKGDWNQVSVNYPALVHDIAKDGRVVMGDGEIELQVESKSKTDLMCRVINGGQLHSRKGVNAPGIKLKEKVPTPKDIEDAEFGVRQGVDWLAMSFVCSVKDVDRLRKKLKELGSDISIVVKIERREALDHIDELLEAANGMMIARGDLGLELPIEQVPPVQKDLVFRAFEAVVPSIVATQMLESMIVNPRPTRAEVTDVFNAVLDGVDAVMLSGETAIGAYPFEAVRTMARIALTAEQRINYEERFRSSARHHERSIPEAVARNAVGTAIAIDARVIISCSRSGQTALFVSNNRPPAKIAVVSPHEDALQRSMLYWNTHPVKIPLSHDTDALIADAKAAVLESGIAQKGDRVVVVAGVPVDVPGTTNMIMTDKL